MKTNIFYFLLFCMGICQAQVETSNIYAVKMDSFLNSDMYNPNYDVFDDSVDFTIFAVREAMFYQLVECMKKNPTYSRRYNAIDYLRYITMHKDSAAESKSTYKNDPLWFRQLYFRTAMQWADHNLVDIYIGKEKLNLFEYSEPEKQELMRIFRREYPFNAAADYADYRMSPTNVRALRAYVDRTALNKKLDADSLFDLMYKEEWEEDRQKYENESTSPFLLKRIGELNITELIPEFEAKLRDSLGTYYCALALARMGNKTGIEYFLNSKEADLYDMIYTRNQDLIYAIALRDLENETLFDCDYFDENLTMPISFSTIEDLELWILNMPKILEDDPCRHPEIRTPDKIEACKKWLKENKGKYEFK